MNERIAIMTEHTRSLGSRSAERRTHHREEDDSAYIRRWESGAIISMMLLGSVIGFGVVDAKAQEANRVFGDCKFSQDTIESLKSDIKSATDKIESPEISFVVVYRLDTTNWGQPIQGEDDDFTAAVLCADPDLNVSPVDELPTVNVPEASHTFAIRACPGDPGQEPGCKISDGKFLTRICLTTIDQKAVATGVNLLNCFVIETVP
jgi:hypothetical protein